MLWVFPVKVEYEPASLLQISSLHAIYGYSFFSGLPHQSLTRKCCRKRLFADKHQVISSPKLVLYVAYRKRKGRPSKYFLKIVWELELLGADQGVYTSHLHWFKRGSTKTSKLHTPPKSRYLTHKNNLKNETV